MRKIAHVRRVTSQARVGAKSFSLGTTLSLMVPTGDPHLPSPFPP